MEMLGGTFRFPQWLTRALIAACFAAIGALSFVIFTGWMAAWAALAAALVGGVVCAVSGKR
jgi:hypothetical protein